jgi:hypothetical protein
VRAEPLRNGISAEAQIEEARVDAYDVGTLQRGDFLALVHVPNRELRQRRETVRQRLWAAKVRARLRNLIYLFLNLHHGFERATCEYFI